MSDPPAPAAQPLPRRRLAIAGAALLVLLVAALALDVFAATELRCQRNSGGTRCTVADTQLGVLTRGTLLVADVQGAYVEDEDFSRKDARLVLQAKGGDTPIAGSAGWSSSQLTDAAAQLEQFVSDPQQAALRVTGSPRSVRAWFVLAMIGLLVWLGWPQLRPVLAARYENLPVTPLSTDHGEPVRLPVTPVEPLTPMAPLDRALGLLTFRKKAYRALGEDRRMTWLSLGVVLFVSLAVGYADALGGASFDFNGTLLSARPEDAKLRALAACAAALVSWPAAAVLSSWFAAGRGGVRTLPLLRALGFANVFHLVSLFAPVGFLAWPLFFFGAYKAIRGVCMAGRLRSMFAMVVGQGVGLFLAVPLWISIISYTWQ